MHHYWVALFSKDYENPKYEQEWIGTYNGEILFARDKTDKMLSRLAAFIGHNPEYKLLITSSMGQSDIECEPLETQLYLVDKDKFMSMLGVSNRADFETLPSMLPQFNFSLVEAKAGMFEQNLNQLRVNGEPVVYRRLEGRGFSIDLGHPNLKETEITLSGRIVDLNASGMENVVIEDKSSSTAYHIPEGHLFSYHPSFVDAPFAHEQLPTAEIAPLILNSFGIKLPDYMTSVVRSSV